MADVGRQQNNCLSRKEVKERSKQKPAESLQLSGINVSLSFLSFIYFVFLFLRFSTCWPQQTRAGCNQLEPAGQLFLFCCVSKRDMPRRCLIMHVGTPQQIDVLKLHVITWGKRRAMKGRGWLGREFCSSRVRTPRQRNFSYIISAYTTHL